jgi:isopentenyl-diphosphate delta-isomerase
LKFELGINTAEIVMALPDYRYKVEKDGVVENEICPVMVGYTTEEPTRNPDEVEAARWIPWNEWVREVTNNPEGYSPWCVEETKLLVKAKKI